MQFHGKRFDILRDKSNFLAFISFIIFFVARLLIWNNRAVLLYICVSRNIYRDDLIAHNQTHHFAKDGFVYRISLNART